MTVIELSDSVGTRRIPAPSLSDGIRIELDRPEGPRVIVPSEIDVERRDAPASTPTEPGEPI